MFFKEAYDKCLTIEHRIRRLDWPEGFHVELGSHLVYIWGVFLCQDSKRLHTYPFKVGELLDDGWEPSPYIGESAFFREVIK